ncbi:MAG: two-component regulator propeller domain-containing protein, partial [Bacteroidota bacterium]
MNTLPSYLTSLLPLLLSAGLFSQSPMGHFEALTSEDGLTENHVNCIYQDVDGFMWFGTFDGLNRYDGYTIKTYKPNPEDSTSLSSILVYAITGDENGNLWIGTTGGGLNFYNAETDRFTNYRVNLQQANSI